MQVARWGNSLAVRIPAQVARELGLKEGDEITLRAGAGGQVDVVPDEGWQDAIEAIRQLARPLPPDYKFDREEANAR